MAVNFKIPASPAIQTYESNTFLGVDFTTDSGNVDDTKSPNMVNMIRSVPGKVRKRMGYQQVADLDGAVIWGVHYYAFADVWLIHAGDKLYQFRGGGEQFWIDHDEEVGNPSHKVVTEDDFYIFLQGKTVEETSDMVLLYEGMAETRSTAYELNQLLCILDGKKMLYVRWDKDYDVLECMKMEDYKDIKIPIVRISCDPKGAGRDYEEFNLLTTKFEQDFLIDSANANATTLQLYTDKLADDEVKMQILQANGTWVDKTENVDFTVNRNTGLITFASSTTVDKITSARITNSPLAEGHWSGDYYQVIAYVLSYTNTSVSYTISMIKEGVHYRDRVLSFPYTIQMTITTNSGRTINTSFKVDADRYSYQYHYNGVKDFTSELTTSTTWKPGVTPIAGEDNIKVIAAYIPTSGTKDVINHCRFGVLFGVNGASDRLFVSGNLDEGNDLDELGNVTGTYSLRNRSWYSGQYDPTYFPDTGYSQLGSDASAIKGMAIVNSYLATFKDNYEQSQSVFIQEGDMVSTDDGYGNEISRPAFKLINTLHGAGAISSWCFDYLEVEPIFLSEMGIYSLTSQDITGEKYAQNRSYYLDGKLLKERNMNNAMAITWNDYYVLCVNNHFYILDGLQPIQTDKSKPYATRQYASFYFEFELNEGEQISYIWEMYGMFYFGTTQGRVMRFYKDEEDIKSYNDNGNAYKALLETADIAGKLFYKNKTFRYIALKLTPARNSSILIEGKKNGIWDVLKEEYAKTKYFSFIDLTFSRTAGNKPRFTFLCDKTQKVVSTKTRIKKADKVQFRFSNAELNEPMGINNFALEYTSGSNIK